MNVSRGRGRHLECAFCHRDYRDNEARLCDYPIGAGKTCDAQMCSRCSVTLGSQETDIGAGMKRLGDTIDLCPLHRTQAVVRGGKLILR